MPVLELFNIDAFYGPSHVLHQVSISVNEGEAVLLLGRNGAGKSTLMKTVMGLVSVRSGRIVLRASDITGLDPHRIARLGIGFVPEDRRMFSKLTVAQNLELGRKRGADSQQAWDLNRVFDLFPTLRSLLDRKAGYLSGGQQQMVAIARTLLGNPTLLLLDEPAEGLAPVVAEELAARLSELRAVGLSLVISEQNPSFARAIADRAYVLETGAIRYSGSLAELDRNPDQWTKFISF
jgi:branched-chain amino acid transport system ATP-binding protein